MSQNSIILGKNGDLFQYINCDAEGKLNVNLDSETIDVHVDFPEVQDVAVKGKVDVSGIFWPAVQPVSITGSSGTLPISGTVNVGELPLIAITNTAFQVSNLSSVPLINGFSLDVTSQSTNTKLETLITKNLSKNTDSIDISGQRVVTDISGQRVTTDISGQRVDISGQRVVTDISGQRVVTDISGQRVITDISGQRVDISGQSIVTDISGQRVDISGQRVTTDISGQRVVTDISGQRVVTDISGQRVMTDISGQRVDISGQRVITDISGQTVDISGQRVVTDISGQRVLTDISGQRVITDISGQRVVTDISGQRVDISGQRVIIDISGQTVDISGQRVIIDISGQRIVTDISGQRVITDISGQRVDISGQRVITDISGQRVDISGQRVITDISGQTVDISGQRVVTDISGQRVVVDISGQRVVTDISGQRVLTDISGFALETGGNLASIKSNTDKFKFGTGDNLKCEVVNSGTNNLGVAVSNQISGFALETGGNLALLKVNSDKLIYDTSGNLKVNVVVGGDGATGNVNIKDSSGNYIYADLSGNLKTNIQNSSLDTHCYGSSDGTLWHQVKTTTAGNLITESKTHDGSNNPITSTLIGGAKRSLDVNVANPVSLTQQASYGISYQDPGVYPLTIQQTAYAGNLLKVFSCNVQGNPTYLEQETQLGSIITNTDNTNTKLDTVNTSVGTVNTSVGTVNTSIGTTNTTLSTINGKLTTTTNDNSVVGLNVYNIYPKRLIYRMAGSSTAVQAYQFLGPEANAAYDGRTFTIGINQLKDFNIYIVSGASPKSVDIDYIDSSCNRVLSTISITNVDTVRLSNAVNINNLNWTPTIANGNNTGRVIARNVAFRNQLSEFLSGAGVVTVPNGYIGIVSNLYYYATLGDSVQMIVRDKYNNIKTARYMEGINVINAKYNNIGDINEQLIAGDSVYFMNVNPNAGGRSLHAIVTMEPL